MNPEGKDRANDASSPARELDDLTEVKHLLRQAMPPLPPDQLESRSDLWPQLRTRLESQRNANHVASNINRESSRTRVAWFDWALAALATAALILFPGIIPALLYHF